VTANGDRGEPRPQGEDLRVVLGVFADSPDEPRQVRLLSADGQERAVLTGVLAWDEGEGWVRFTADEGGGLAASLTIPVDPATRCTIREDGTMTGTLPGGASWISTPWGNFEDDEDERG